MGKVMMTLTGQVEVGPKELAQAFCDLNDEQQADFFEAVGGIADGWSGTMQFFMVGRHMKTCECVTQSGIRVIEEIHDGLTTD